MHVANCINMIKSIVQKKKKNTHNISKFSHTCATVEVKNRCYNSIKMIKKYTS
jgi:hypothetical protein